MELIAIVVGLILLLKGGDWLMKSAVAISLGLNISRFVIGMTVVSFATSAPELFVSLQAVFRGSGDISLGNSIGSNIANLALVLAITAMIFRVKIPSKVLSLNYPLMLISSLILALVLYYFKSVPTFIGYLFLLLLFLYILILN